MRNSQMEDMVARAHETAHRHTLLKAGPGEPLIALPTEDGGTIYYTSEEAARADLTDETLQAALDLAGRNCGNRVCPSPLVR